MIQLVRNVEQYYKAFACYVELQNDKNVIVHMNALDIVM